MDTCLFRPTVGRRSPSVLQEMLMPEVNQETASPFDQLLRLLRDIRVQRQAGWVWDGKEVVSVTCTLDELVFLFPFTSTEWKQRAIDAVRTLTVEMGVQEEETKWRSGV